MFGKRRVIKNYNNYPNEFKALRANELYSDMLNQPHLMIAGATGSGKSVVINGMIINMVRYNPNRYQLILIDPKRVELVQYKDFPHCIKYASEITDIIEALNMGLNIVENRFREMQKCGLRKYEGSDVFIIIDEFADLMTMAKKQTMTTVQRLAQIGRAAKVHVVLGTQSPISAIIPTQIKVNFDARLGLRTRCAQDSRNILGQKGCELLPRYGKGYYMRPEGIELVDIMMYHDNAITILKDFWK